MNALNVLSHEKGNVNPVDQVSLLRLLSGMSTLRTPLAMSPLAKPSLLPSSTPAKEATASSYDSLANPRPGASIDTAAMRAKYPMGHVAVPHSDSEPSGAVFRPPELNAKLALAVRFAHRHRSAPVLTPPRAARTLPITPASQSKLAAEKRMQARYPLYQAQQFRQADLKREAEAKRASELRPDPAATRVAWRRRGSTRHGSPSQVAGNKFAISSSALES